MRMVIGAAVLMLGFVPCVLLGQTTRPGEVTKTFVAAIQRSAWAGWAKSDQSVPGWGNRPPEPGTVTVVPFEKGQERTFSGRVDGLDSMMGAEVGVVSLTYIYWNKKDAYHWAPVEADGTFSIIEDKYPSENKAVILRAPGHPWTFLSYIFKGNEGGKDIVLHAEAGKAVRVTVEVAGVQSRDFGVEFFALNKSWMHENNPLGYQWASRNWTPEDSDGNLTLYFPLHPIAVYVSADGGANDWEIVDAREADHFHFVLLPSAYFNLTVVKDGEAVKGTAVLMGNDSAALSLRGGETDGAGKWTAGGLVGGRWWLKIGKKTAEFDLGVKQTMNATFDLGMGELDTGE